ncbi:MAG: helix-turn-helix domain-containing protein [Lachnospiraceae bacterium]|nr:helix-turn-helix domain-containing protein [Lachnospiraceae bacterium]
MKKIDLYVGYRIRGLRENQNYSREKLAELAGISSDFLSDIENGKKSFTVSVLQAICKALDINPDFILFGNESGIDKSSFLLSQMDEGQLRLAIEIMKAILQGKP